MIKRLKKEFIYSSIHLFVLPLLVFLISFSFYVFTLSATISAGDSTEITTAAISLGVPHPPSYPLYTIIGHFFSQIPFGPGKVWRVNLMSALFESLTVVLVYFILIKICSGVSRKRDTYFLAFSASLFLAFSLNFWQYATRAEVFSFNNFLVSLLILGALSLDFARDKGDLGEKRRRFYLTAFLAGLAVTHHPTAIIVFPALLYLLLGKIRAMGIIRDDRGRRINWRFLGKTAFLGFLGFGVYYLLLTSLAKTNPLLNWGNPVGLEGVLRALTRADYGIFSAYLVGFGEEIKTVPLEQLKFYLSNLVLDFTPVGFILGVLGAFWVFRQDRKVFWFLLFGWGTGAAFLVYANFPLGDSFHQATTKRFQLLPDLFFAGFLGWGLKALWEKFLSLKLNLREKTNFFATAIVFLVLVFIFIIPLIANFSKADNRHNRLAVQYGRDFYRSTEENAILLLSGDISNFVAYYIKAVELGGDRRIVFTPGQFHLGWFIPQLNQRYPDLLIPLPMPGKRWTTTSQIIEANLGRRPVYISPELVMRDPEIEQKYVLWPKSLLFKVRKKGGEEKLEAYREESQRIWQGVDLSLFVWVRKNRPLMEESIISYYVRYFHNLGFMFESVKLYEDAVREYQRAVEIDPEFSEGVKSLGVVYGYKMKPPRYDLAIGYFNRYLSLLPEVEIEKIKATQGAIWELQNQAYKEYLEAVKQASPSGKKD